MNSPHKDTDEESCSAENIRSDEYDCFAHNIYEMNHRAAGYFTISSDKSNTVY